MIDIELLKRRKKELNLSYDDIAEKSKIPRRTVISIFTEQTKTPRVDTLEAIEKALELDNVNDSTEPPLSDEEKALLLLFSQIPKDKQQLVLEMIKVALSGK